MLTWTYRERNDLAIATLDPAFQVLVRYLMFKLWRNGEEVLIVEGFRNKADQQKEFNEGNSHVLWPYSWHNHGLAIDVVPVLFGQTTVLWNAAARYERIAHVAIGAGMEWGYALWNFDKPHFMYTQGKPIQHFIDGNKIEPKAFIQNILDEYKREYRNMENAMRFATGSRKKKLKLAMAYTNDLMEDALKWA